MPRPSNASTTRYYPLPISFFTDPDTAGLSPMAACLYLRARAASLIGVLQLSPRVLGRAHGATEDEVLDAIDQLTARDLALWDSDHEILVIWHSLEQAQGSARTSAVRQVAALPHRLRDLAMARMTATEPPVRTPGPTPLDLPGTTPPDPKTPIPTPIPETDSESEGAPVPVDPVEAAAGQVLARIDTKRAELGLRPLPPSQRSTRHLRARMVDDGVPLADLLLAVDLRAAECRERPEAIRYFDATSPFTGPGKGPGGWAVSARMIDEAHRRERSRGGRGGGRGGAPAAPPGDTKAQADYTAEVERQRLARLRELDTASRTERPSSPGEGDIA